MTKALESHIPRFPATNSVIEAGKLLPAGEKVVGPARDLPGYLSTSITAEPLAEGMPNEHQTVFTPDAIRSIDITIRYTDPTSNRLQRDQLLNEARSLPHETFTQWAGYVREHFIPSEDEAIPQSRYKNEMFDDLIKKTTPSQEKKQEPSPIATPVIAERPRKREKIDPEQDAHFWMYEATEEPPLPEQVDTEMPAVMIRAANRCLEAAFPDEYKSGVLPRITSDDILIYDHRDLSTYLRRHGYFESHPKRFEAGTALVRELGVKAQEPNFAIIATQHSDPAKPILFPEREITGWSGRQVRGVPERARLSQMIGSLTYTLVHEGIHRASEGVLDPTLARPLDLQDSTDQKLFSMAFTSDRYSNALTKAPQARAARTRFREELEEFARANNPSVIIEGTRVVLFCTDNNGRQRLLVESGYDLNEAIISMLGYNSMNELYEVLREQGFNILEIQEVGKSLEHIFVNISGSPRLKNHIPDTLPYLKRLGLEGPWPIFNAYRKGEIPLLHAKMLGDEDYLV